MMGNPDSVKELNYDEGPVHLVTVKPFWLGKYEVTQEQWEAVMDSNPSYFKGDDLPMDAVSWDDCQEFIKRLNGLASNGGFRLPSEAEWEYTCRAGSDTRFCYGDDADYSELGNYAWYASNSAEKTRAVGGKQANAWGLYDMHGNVEEWCQDWYHDSYRGAPTDGSPWESPAGEFHVSRGGHWYSLGLTCRSAYRMSWAPEDIGCGTRGFRCARTVQ